MKGQIGGSKEVRLESRGARIADAVWDLGAALPLGRWKLSRYQHLDVLQPPVFPHNLLSTPEKEIFQL